MSSPPPDAPLLADQSETHPSAALQTLSPVEEAKADLAAGATSPHGSRETFLSLGAALTLYLLSGLGVVLAGGPAILSWGLAGLLVVHLAFVLGMPLAWLTLRRLPLRENLSMNAPRKTALLGAALLGASLWSLLVAIVLPLQERILPLPKEFVEQREALLARPETVWGWVIALLATAVVPALGEEVLFRGVLLQSALRSLRRAFPLAKQRLLQAQALAGVSLLFALFHFNPYQLVLTWLQGMVLGMLCLRTGSLFSAMMFHLLNNTVVLLLTWSPWEEVPTPVLVALGGVAVLGTLLAGRTDRPQTEVPVLRKA